MPTTKGRSWIYSSAWSNRNPNGSFYREIDGCHRALFADSAREPLHCNFHWPISRYVEASPVPDQTAKTLARVYATQIVTRHGTGSQLITDQGPAFMSSFFQETCKLLGIRRTRTTCYHPMSNGFSERWHRSLHTGLSHYINSANTNWDNLVQFFSHGLPRHTKFSYWL